MLETVLVDRNLSDDERTSLASVCAERATLLTLADVKARPEHLTATTVLFSTRSLPWPLDALPALRWVHSWSSGTDKLVACGVLAAGAMLTSSLGISADAVADHALAGMLWFYRRLSPALRRQKDRRWGLNCTPAPDSLAGKTAAVVGLGNVGAGVTRRVAAFGMRTLAVDRTGTAQDTSGGRPGLLAAFRQAHVAVLTLPYSAETEHLVGAAELDALGPDGLLVNVARGGLVDEAALVEALRNGRLGGAVLDTVEEEPLPSSSPLWAFDEVLITPHVAWQSQHFQRRAVEYFGVLLDRYLAGRDPIP